MGAAALPREVSVLIAGGGPIGLALAGCLGKRGIETLLAEQREDRIGSAKMIVVSMRTMELCRQLGVAEDVRNWGFPLDRPLDSVFCTALTGHELGRVRTPSLRVDADTPYSPERERPCPQTWFDPILQRFARRCDSVRLAYGTRLVSFLQDETGVSAAIENEDGEVVSVRARYLIGCDGYSSTVRDLLGIEVRGQKHLDRSMSVYIRSSELDECRDFGPAYRYVVVGENGPWGVFTTMDGKGLWRVQLIGGRSGIDVDKADLDVLLRAMVGREVAYTIEDTSAWIRKMTVADRFSDGRVFLAGDSAHAHPPNGGLGMNTGIQDAFDLGWKLAAVLQGWGGETLLRSYDVERRPASSRAAEESLRNYHRLTGGMREPAIAEDSEMGRQVRKRVGARLVEENEKAWHPIGVHIGYSYDPSPIVIPDGTPRPQDDTVGYTPSARPGARAPHGWLADGVSTLDWFGDGFVLLSFDAAADTSGAEQAASARSIPFVVQMVRNADVAELYVSRFVLVRPDGHVAWRSDDAPVDWGSIFDTVTGCGPFIAARRA